MSEVFSRGLLVIYTLNNPKVVRIEPPLNIPMEILETGLSVIKESLNATREFARDM